MLRVYDFMREQIQVGIVIFSDLVKIGAAQGNDRGIGKNSPYLPIIGSLGWNSEESVSLDSPASLSRPSVDSW